MAQLAQQAIPAEAHRLADLHKLGVPFKEYQDKFLIKILIATLLSILGIVSIGLAYFAFFLAPDRYPPSALLLLLGGIGLVFWAVSVARTARRNHGARVYLCTEGLMLLKDSGVEAIRWDQITELRQVFTHLYSQYRTRGFLKQYQLHRADGSKLVLDNAYRHFRELGITIEQEITRRRLPETTASYNAGHTIDFGPIRVNSRGFSVQMGTKTLSWHEVKKIKIVSSGFKSGLVIIERRGKAGIWDVVRISEIPNVCVLAALVSNIMHGSMFQNPQAQIGYAPPPYTQLTGDPLSQPMLEPPPTYAQLYRGDLSRPLNAPPPPGFVPGPGYAPAGTYPTHYAVPMTEQSIEVEAESLEEAKAQVRSQIPEGFHLLSEQVISDGKPKTVKASADTTEAAFAQAQSKIPINAKVLQKKQLTAPEQKVITIEASDEASARVAAWNQIGADVILKSIKLVVAGKEGFLGMGAEPNQYEANLLQKAVVEIIYKTKAKISAKIVQSGTGSEPFSGLQQPYGPPLQDRDGLPPSPSYPPTPQSYQPIEQPHLPASKGAKFTSMHEFVLDTRGRRLQVSKETGVGGEHLVVLIDRSVIGTISEQEARTTGREFTLPDDTVLRVQLVYGQVQAWRNGQLLLPATAATRSGSKPSLPPKSLNRLRVAYGVTFFIGGLDVLFGILLTLSPSSAYPGVGPLLLIFGAFFLLLGIFVVHRSTVALGVVVGVYVLDGLLLLFQGNLITVLVHIILLIFLIRGFSAIREILAAEATP